MPSNQGRRTFRENCLERDDGMCVVPWCEREADDVHHIIERAEWENGGYIERNGASVCNMHHRYAEETVLPPQAFWSWVGLRPATPSQMGMNVDKWGEQLSTYDNQPPLTSGRHLPFSSSWGDGDHEEIEQFAGLPLVAFPVEQTELLTMSVTDSPIGAIEPPLTVYKQGELVLGVYQPAYELWLSWDDTVSIAAGLGLDTPELLVRTDDDATPPFTATYELYDGLREQLTPDRAAIRSRFPMHVAQVHELTATYTSE